MKLATRVAMAMTAAVLVLPAAAGAHTGHAHASKADVAALVKQAHRSLKRVQAWAGSDAAYAQRQLVQNRRATAAASRAARKLSGASAAASGLSAVATQYDQNVSAYSKLVGATSGALQAALAQALQPALAGRQHALNQLQGLIGQLPAAQKVAPSKVIGSITESSTGEVSTLTGLLSGGTTGDLPSSLQELISQALATASGLIESGIAQIQSLIPSLPPEAQGILTQVLGIVTSTLPQVFDLLQSVVGSLPTMVTGQISQVMSIIQQLLGGFLGGGSGSGGSSCTSPLPIPSFLSGLLGGLLGGLTGGCPAPTA